MAKRTNDIENTDFQTGGAEVADIVPAEAPAEKLSRVIYVGPNIPGGALQRFQVFKGGLPPYCEDLIKKVPEIKGLFIPVEGLEATRRKIEEPGTNEARLFYAAQTALNKGVK